MIIGLAGYARSGKDSAADALESVGFRRIAFADKLREFMYEMNPQLKCNGIGMYLTDVIDNHGWDGYKNTIWSEDIRRWMQVVGTNCVRDILGPDTWANATFNMMESSKNYVITDVRFPNEVRGIWQRGGFVYRIWRPGIEPANGHSSETALDDMALNGVLENTGTLEQFKRNVVQWLDSIV